MAKKKRSKFKGKVAADTQRQKTAGAQYGHLNLPKGVSVFKVEPGGRASFDVIPYEVTDPNHMDRNDKHEVATPGELWYKKPYKLHRNVGVQNDAVVCPTSSGQRCPICEYKAARLKEGVEYDEVKELRPSLRNLYLVIPKGMKDYDEKVHVWDISQFCFQDILNDELAEEDDYGVFPDLEEGMTLRVRFSAEKLGKNPFAKASRIDFEERDQQYHEDLLKKLPNLDEVLTMSDYATLEAKFFELETEQAGPAVEEEEPEEEAPKPKPVRKRKDTKPEPEEDPEPEEGPEEEEEEEEEKPAPKPARKRKEQAAEKPAGKKKAKGKCPFDHTFGVDTDEYEDCDECEEWDNCIEEKES